MKLTDWMDEKGLCVGVTLTEKEGVIDILTALQQKCGNTERGKQLKREIYNREEENSFAIGAGVALCFLKTKAVKRPLITAVTVPMGIDLNAPDGENSRLIFLVAVPLDETRVPTSKLTVMLMNENLREQLMDAADEHTFMELMRLSEEGDYPDADAVGDKTKLVLAVVNEEMESATEAAAQLQITAGRCGMLLKIERDGMPLFTDEDIRDACGIFMIGRNMNKDRFDGKPVLDVEISDGLYRPEHLLKSVESAPIYHKKIHLRIHKKRLEDWYYQSNVPLLPQILLAGGIFMFAGEIFSNFSGTLRIGETLSWIGGRSLLLLVPRVCGMLGFRYARWPGLAVGLIGGGILEIICGGAWAALVGGAVTVLVMQWLERRISRFPSRFQWVEWISPVIGILSVTTVGFLWNWGTTWIEPFFLQLVEADNVYLTGFVVAVGAGLDPGGSLERAAIRISSDPVITAALVAGGLALSLGITAYAILCRKKLDKIHCANSWAALPAGLCGAIKSYLVFYAGDPFRTAFSAGVGSGAAGLLAASMGCLTEKKGIIGVFTCNYPMRLSLAILCGAVLCCVLLFVLSPGNESSHEV